VAAADHRLPLAERDQETDIEAIAFGGGHLYVIGSHSSSRRRMKAELSVWWARSSASI
jgi:hypothetical protein